MADRYRIRDYRDPVLPAMLRSFYASPHGEALVQDMQVRLAGLLSGLFGFHAVQVGHLTAGVDLLSASPIRHRIYADTDGFAPSLRMESGALPLQSDSVDLVFLAHTLDFAVDPYQVLREVERVLIPDGHVLILGFNPLSSYGLRKLVSGWNGAMPWCGRFYLATRVADWLSLLGFEIRARNYLGYRPPMGGPSMLNRLQFMEGFGSRWLPNLGGLYLLLAQKHVAAITPIRPRWLARRALFPAKLTQPAANRSAHG